MSQIFILVLYAFSRNHPSLHGKRASPRASSSCQQRTNFGLGGMSWAGRVVRRGGAGGRPQACGPTWRDVAMMAWRGGRRRDWHACLTAGCVAECHMHVTHEPCMALLKGASSGLHVQGGQSIEIWLGCALQSTAVAWAGLAGWPPAPTADCAARGITPGKMCPRPQATLPPRRATICGP
jgi:hypothetical protein